MTKTTKGYSATPSVRLNELAGPLLKRAEQENVKPAEVIRRALKSYLQGSTTRRIEDTAGLLVELRALRSELHRIGLNFNQIARALNMEETVEREKILAAHMDLRRNFIEVQSLFEAVADDLAKTS